MPVSGRQTERYTAELSLPKKPEVPPPCKGTAGGNWAREPYTIMPECEGNERPRFSFSPLQIHTSMAFFSFFNFQATTWETTSLGWQHCFCPQLWDSSMPDRGGEPKFLCAVTPNNETCQIPWCITMSILPWQTSESVFCTLDPVNHTPSHISP